MALKTIQKLIKLLKHKNRQFTSLVEEMHPSDMAELVEKLNDEQKKELFELLDDNEAALIIPEMEDVDQVSLFQVLDKEKASSILKEMSSDEAVDLLSELPPAEAQELLTRIEDPEEIEGLLKFPEDTAGGLMTTEYLSLPENMPVEEAIQRLREVASEVETIYYIYVIDEENRLIGVLSLRELISAEDGTLLKDIMKTNVINVDVNLDQKEVARVVSRYDLLAVPVIDGNDSLRGIITVDDILDVLEEEATEDIYRLVGTSEVRGVDLINASVFNVSVKRLPWLIVCLIGGLFPGSVIGV
ncbi:MAG: magnesium transporter, partial [Candidatus Syntrophonatronum acetioxidans]